MNDSSIEKAISEIIISGYTLKCSNQNLRIENELDSMEKLVRKPDFLSLYNRSIRLMFLFSLNRGYDIKQKKVHSAFSCFSNYILLSSNQVSYGFVKARHDFKYYGKRPDNETFKGLNDLYLRLKGYYNLISNCH